MFRLRLGEREKILLEMVTETVIIVFKARKIKIKKGSYKNELENFLSCSSRLRTTERTITQCR